MFILLPLEQKIKVHLDIFIPFSFIQKGLYQLFSQLIKS